MGLPPKAEERRGGIAGPALSTALAGAVNSARGVSYKSRLYNMTLKGPMPDRVLHIPKPATKPDRARADACLSGLYALPGGQVQLQGGTPFDAKAPSRQWAHELQSFDWLWDFNARPGSDTSKHAGWLVNCWLERYRKCEGMAWEPHILGRRLVSWYANWPLIVGTADMVWRSSLLLSMARQARHLRRSAASAPAGAPRLTAAWALALTGLCMPNEKKAFEKGMELLERELQDQVLADGGHISRAPDMQLKVLGDLLLLRDGARARNIAAPRTLQATIDRMAPAIEFFRHGDGGLGFFNGSGQGDRSAIDAAVASDEVITSSLNHLPHTGFHRLQAQKTLLLMDAGTPPAGPHSTRAHAGCLSFELSIGQNRLITNCGNIAIHGAAWQDALRATPAHSTLVVNNTSSAGFVEDGWSRRLLGARMTGGPHAVTSIRRRKDIGLWLDASHDGYAEKFGLTHERRLFLAASGDDLRGEDLLIMDDGKDMDDGTGMDGPDLSNKDLDVSGVVQNAVVRFHLHPDVKVSLARDKSSVLLLLPNREGWQFHARGGDMSLESSVYAADTKTIRRTNQIVLTANNPQNKVQFNWAFTRLPTP